MALQAEVSAEVLIVELGVTYTTPFTVEVDPGTYTLRATYPTTGETLPDRTTTITEGIRTREDFYFTAPTPTYTLTVATTAGGSTDPTPRSYVYDEGATATVTAIPNTGYQFDHWTLNGTSRTENPISIIMNRDYALTAYFTALPPVEYTLTINTTTGGTTLPAPGTYTYSEGTTVGVAAFPDTGYVFDHWILDGETYTTSPLPILMDKDHTLTAYFSEEAPPPPETYKLTISSTIGGTTNPTPGIHTYDAGTTVTVTATPENGYYFNHWELDGAAKTENPINVLMDKDHTLLAVFSTVPPPPKIPSWIILPVIIGGVFIGYLLTKKK